MEKLSNKKTIVISVILFVVLCILVLISITSESIRPISLNESMVETQWRYKQGELIELNPEDQLFDLNGNELQPNIVNNISATYYDLPSGKYRGIINSSYNGKTAEVVIIVY